MSGADLPRRKVRAEAAAWLARLRTADLTETERLAFQAWLHESAEHAQAFEAANSVWESIGAVTRDSRRYGERETAGGTRRKMLVGAAFLSIAGIGAAYWQSAEAAIYETEVGEQRHIILKDGCQVFLDTNTRLAVGTQSIQLERGCANFRVMRDDNRPLIVNVADQTIATTRSNMDVRHDGDRVSVLVIEGEAALSKTLDYDVRRLGAGDRFTRTGSQQPKIDRPLIGPLLAWQNGQAMFRNDRLGDAVAEMNRYSVAKLVIIDPKTANSRISGVYSVGDNLAFANSIAKFLPVHVSYSDKRIDISAYEPQ